MRSFWLLAIALLLPQIALAQLPTEPVQGYVYVEAFELRKEFAVQLRAFPEWKDLAAAGESVGPDEKEKLLQDFAAKFAKASPLQIDGTPPELTLDRISFVRIMDPQTGVIPDEREEIPVSEALIAAIFVTPQPGFPKELTLQWDLYPDGVTEVPVTFVSPSKRNTLTFLKGQVSQAWSIPATEKVPGLLKVPEPPVIEEARLPVISLILIGIAVILGLAARVKKGLPPAVGIAAVSCVLLAFLTWGFGGITIKDPYAEELVLTDDETRKIVLPVLRNIYHAFDHRDESRIYDTLEVSVTGDLLEKIYLDIHKGLVLEEQGGPQVKVENVDLREVSSEPIGERRGVRADAEWIALGSVSHWGHLHQRLNKYHAWLTLEPIDNQWKVTAIEIVEEGRLPLDQ